MSCLFQSLSSFVSHNDYSKLRQDICNFLQQNPNMSGLDLKTIMETENISIEDYVRQMRSNATWGGAIEIKAFCDMYNVNVLVKNIRNENRDPNIPDSIEFLCNDTNINRWVEITWNGGHFEPILE